MQFDCPSGWKLKTVGECVDLLTGYPFSSEHYTEDQHAIRLLRGDNVIQMDIRWENAQRWPSDREDGLEKYELSAGDIVLAMDRSWVKAGLKCARIEEDDLPCFLVQRVARLRGIKGESTSFLFHVLNSHRFIQYVKGVQTETAVPHISTKQIKDFRFLSPPFCEQQWISSLLDAHDLVANQISNLIGQKNKMLAGLMQKLLSGLSRLDNFADDTWKEDVLLGDVPGSWSVLPLRQIVSKVTRRNSMGETHVLTASGRRGLVDQNDYFNRSVAGANLAGYYLLKNGEFAYNRSRMKGYQYGAIKRLDKYPQGVLSTLYLCFGIKSADVDSDYLQWYFEGGQMGRQLARVTPVGGRAHGLLNITAEDFYSIKIMLPPKDEQIAIAKVLNTAQREIDLLEDQLQAIKTQKKGLIQKLLTGQVRVHSLTPSSTGVSA